MMRTATVVGLLLLAAIGALLASQPQFSTSAPWVIIVGIIEGPDPIPLIEWGSDEFIGSRYGGTPALAYVEAQPPLVVWSHSVGTDFDVAATRQDGTGWQPVEYLSSTSADELDPRAFVEDDGTIHVVWWVDVSTPRIEGVTSDGSGWQSIDPLFAVGRRPSAIVVDGTMLVTYERDAAEGGQHVVVRELDEDGTWSEAVAAWTPRIERLDPILHLEQGRRWVDWKQSAGEIGWSEASQSGWSAPQGVPWTNPSWLGEQQARQLVEEQVLDN